MSRHRDFIVLGVKHSSCFALYKEALFLIFKFLLWVTELEKNKRDFKSDK